MLTSVPYIIPNKVILCVLLCQPTNVSFPYFLNFYLHWIWLFLCLIWPQPNFEQAPWLRAVPSVGYLYVSIPLSLRIFSQTGTLVGLLLRNTQACSLCYSMWLTCCFFQTCSSERNDLYWCAYIYQFMSSSCYFLYLLHSGCIRIICSV